MSEGNKKLEGNFSGFMSGAISLFSGPSPSSSATKKENEPVENSPFDIPKDELVQLCMKTNKRLQLVESKLNEVNKKKKTILNDRNALLEIFNNSILANSPINENEIDIEFLKESWSNYENSKTKIITMLEAKVASLEQAHQLELISLEQKKEREFLERHMQIQTSSQENSNSFSEIDKNYLLGDIERLTNEKEKLMTEMALLSGRYDSIDKESNNRLQQLEDLKSRLHIRDSSYDELSSKFLMLEKERESSITRYEEKVVYLQMLLDKCKVAEDSSSAGLIDLQNSLTIAKEKIFSLETDNTELSNSLASDKESLKLLQNKLDAILSEHEVLREKVKDYERNISAAAFLKAEQEALLNSVKKELKTTSEARDELSKKVTELDLKLSKNEISNTKVIELEKQIEFLQTSLEEKNSFITRLRQESQTAERNHAMKTAILATCEAQLTALQSESKLKEEALAESLERINVLESRILHAEEKIQSMSNESKEMISNFEATIDSIKADHANNMAEVQKQHEEAMDLANKEFSKKIGIAKTLLAEREGELNSLTLKNIELQAEISSGAPNERRIFELAQSQARRDALYGIHRDTREMAFSQIQDALAVKDLEYATLQQKLANLTVEITDLRRTRLVICLQSNQKLYIFFVQIKDINYTFTFCTHSRREGINMDYLKNIILQVCIHKVFILCYIIF